MLNYLTEVSKRNKYYIISPQLVKLWDCTWDCLVNDAYIHESTKYHKITDPRTIINTSHGKVDIFPIHGFKWGGGWFNGFSMNLLSLVGVPDTFIGYGLDDTFIMECALAMKHHRCSIQQYVLKNSVVMENYIDTHTSFKNQFTAIDIRGDLLRHCKSNYRREYKLFLVKLKQTPYI